MALTSFLSFFILVPLLIRGLSAQLSGEQDFYWQNLQTQQQHKLQAGRIAGSTDSRRKNPPSVLSPRPGSPSSGTGIISSSSAPELLLSGTEGNSGNGDSGLRRDIRTGYPTETGSKEKVYGSAPEALLSRRKSTRRKTKLLWPAETEAQQGGTNNIFNGFDDEILADAFGVDVQTARRLKGQDDLRGRIVRAERFDIVLPGEEEEERWERDPYSGANGLEETLCTAKLRVNLDEPARADVYNPRGGRISSLNSQTLPILSWLRLSAEKGVLYRNGLVAPHWNLNAHSIIYITRGSGRFQVVGHTGRSVFDGVVREGQLIIVPQNYVVAKRASPDEGLEWISFKTNDNAMTSQLAGRLSAIRAMPEEVVMTAFQVSRDEARRLKYNREESRVFSSTSRYTPRSSRSMSYMPKPFEYALDVIKAIM
ncbi:UNVERIFIED_CONTAM: 11S globulin seed storage protein 1 [Sesamum radiatum]|uniref:11S globulin seed storage protein 1 n=1 Tax=Sesamum radiatum TaxID=300843 RepID=A0AAW2S7C6_SESRA